ncbi:TetR family transcriptional regulator [Agromyces atrinae]|uniref:TetR family transcriptional regulator n=1 Tax=Agromyces atrinae TaxID=592376 RepID=UPI001F5AF229|nr:TetR family transcriptional regulator [Agromyces atrinae]MCI2956205.1 TetR family transcriptional regulator [Agromyces atrinae]
MAWDIERTQQLLLDAATREFCDHGLAGARVDRIASTAGVNKERIYQYFGKKTDLFDTVVATALRRLMDEVPIEGRGAAAMGDYAGRLFDHHVRDRTVPRLLFWEGLERGEDAHSSPERRERHELKVTLVTRVLPCASRREAADLLLTIVSLCDAWVVLPQLDALLAGDASNRVAERRAAIVEAVTLAAQAVVDRAILERGVVDSAAADREGVEREGVEREGAERALAQRTDA